MRSSTAEPQQWAQHLLSVSIINQQSFRYTNRGASLIQQPQDPVVNHQSSVTNQRDPSGRETPLKIARRSGCYRINHTHTLCSPFFPFSFPCLLGLPYLGFENQAHDKNYGSQIHPLILIPSWRQAFFVKSVIRPGTRLYVLPPDTRMRLFS